MCTVQSSYLPVDFYILNTGVLQYSSYRRVCSSCVGALSIALLHISRQRRGGERGLVGDTIGLNDSGKEEEEEEKLLLFLFPSSIFSPSLVSHPGLELPLPFPGIPKKNRGKDSPEE